MTVTLSPQVFAILSSLVEERIGLSFGTDDASLFSDKVVARMTEAGFASPLDYYYALRYDDPAGAHFDTLVDALVVGETYFFREVESLVAALEQVVKRAVEARGAARIWSAACSSGEEPLTIAMLLEDAGLLGSVSIVATDVSSRAIARARKAVYGPRSMRVVAEGSPMSGPLVPKLRMLANRHFVERADGFHADRSLVDAVTYRKLNLLDPKAVSSLGSFDLVVCRNVLIYFADETVRAVVDSLAGALEPDGRLLAGASESLMRFATPLECEERGGVFLYRKARP